MVEEDEMDIIEVIDEMVEIDERIMTALDVDEGGEIEWLNDENDEIDEMLMFDVNDEIEEMLYIDNMRCL